MDITYQQFLETEPVNNTNTTKKILAYDILCNAVLLLSGQLSKTCWVT